jgi:hypothetical protein
MLLTLLLACAPAEPPTETVAATPDADSAAAGELLCNLAASAKLPCQAEGGAVTLADHAVTLRVVAKPAEYMPGRTIGVGASAMPLPGSLALHFSVEVDVDGAPMPVLETSHRATGEGPVSADARALALEAGLQRWGLSTGAALVDTLTGGTAALQSLGEAAAPLETETHRVTRGIAMQKALAGLAGQSNSGRMVLDQARMLDAVGPLVPNDSALHAVHVDVGLDPNGTGCDLGSTKLTGELRIDGQPSDRMCEVLSTYPWPGGGAVMGVEVLYLFSPKDEPAG